MKVLITNKYKTWKRANTGKGKFVRRLIPALQAEGIRVFTDPNERCDIQLGIGKFVYKTECTKKILRLGPVHLWEADQKRLNRPKKKAYKNADGIVFQSEFCRELAGSFFGKTQKPTATIFNGADPAEFDVEPWPSDYKHVFMASTRKWTKQKRLSLIVDAFWESGVEDSCLYICGGTNQPKMDVINRNSNSAVILTGTLDDRILNRMYKRADLFVNVTYLDACPNAVVEALVAGCAVCCGDSGGTLELVAKTHDVDASSVPRSKYNYQPIRAIPKASVDKLAKCFRKVVRGDYQKPVNKEALYIQSIAKQYIQFFKEVLCQG